MYKIRISSKLAFIVSGIYSLILHFIQYINLSFFNFVNKAMEDTFVGGETSDISITLWISISGIMLFITFLFFFFLRIKDLKSQKTILSGISISWFFISIFQLFLFKNFFYLSALTLIPISICYFAIKNLKIEILKKLNQKGLSEKEIHLLQMLAGINKK